MSNVTADALPESRTSPSPVSVIRSAKRKKTVQARLVNGVMQLRIPARMSAAEERYWVDEMRKRLLVTTSTDEIDLPLRAAELCAAYDLPTPRSIRWVGNQSTRWASCSIDSGDIRVSDRAASFPMWVIDYLIVHEVAHLLEANHSPEFWRIVERYPKTERARGFLIAKGLESSEPPELIEDQGTPGPLHR